MQSTRAYKLYYWSLLAGSVAIATVATNGWAYAAETVPESEPTSDRAASAIAPAAVTLPLEAAIAPETVSAPNFSGGGSSQEMAQSEPNSPELADSDTSLLETGIEAEAAATTEADSSEAEIPRNSVGAPAAAPSAPIASPSAQLTSVSAGQVEILNPGPDSLLDVPAVAVIVRFPTGADLELRVNDQPVSDDLIGRTEADPATGLTTQTWYGVSLSSGTNQIMMVRRSDGSVLQTVEVEVKGAPVSMVLSPRESSIPADGRSTALLQGQLLDENGNVSNWDAVVTLGTSDGQFVGNDYSPDQPGFQVQAQNGRFTAELQSSLETHRVQLQANASGLEAFNQIQFVTPQRPSLATGVVDLRWGARGTDFYSSLRDFLPADGDNSYDLDLNASLFTMGNIGEWLLTAAYNSDRPLNQDCRGETALFRQSSGSCSDLYPVYGDDSTLDVTTPSTDSLYLRLERTSPVEGAAADYLMWGDYNTEEFANTSQLFTSTSRQLHGLKFNYSLGDLTFTGLYGNNIEGFQRDTIAPDGTSGLYFLSRRLVISGSEEVYLELEELNRPGTVVDRQQLFRGSDYDIDYDRGTLLFDDPIAQTALGEFGEVLVRRIVVTYQYEDEGSDTNIIAGRLQYNFDRTFGQASWLGTTYLRENQGTRSFELYGADAQISLGDSGQIIAEVAQSSSDFDLSGPVSGSAYRIEVDGEVADWLSGRAYYRSTDAGFTNSATTTFVPGQTRYGASANAELGPDTRVRAQFDHEDNFGVAPRPITSLSELLDPGTSPVQGSAVDNSLTTYSLGLVQRLGDSNLELDWIHRDRTDRTNPDVLTVSSDQIRTRLTTRVSNNLTVRAQNELTLSSESDPIYPSRTIFGVDWQVMPGITLGVNQIFLSGSDLGGPESFTTVDLTGEHSLGDDTTIRGRFSSIDGQQLGGGIGIEHGFTLAPGLRLDLGYEHTFNSLFGSTAAGTQFTQPYAVGTGASALTTTSGNTYTVGLSYTDNPDLQANVRFEHRDSSQGSNTVLNASALGRLSPAVSVLFNYQLANSANQNISGLGATSNLKLGLAYRDPNDDRFNALLRYEHRLNPGTLPGNLLFGSSIETAEHLFSAEAIYAPSWQWEFFAKYAMRNSSTRIGRSAEAGGDFVSNNTLHLAQMRATYRLGYHWDVTGEARWIGGLGDYTEFGYALEAGYYPTPDLRLYAGYSGGGAYDDDFGVNRSANGFYLGVSAKINSLFDGFGLQNVAPPQQQESLVEVEDEATEVSPVLSEADNSEAAPALSEVSDGSEGTDIATPTIQIEDGSIAPRF
ncbi:MAG: TonB-dependent receptor [Cyanobacteria bacterium P01_D01_bin.14]